MAQEDPTEDIIKREIAAAREIIRSDRIMGKLNKHFPDEPEGEGDGNPKPPKKKDEPDPTPPKRGGLWWGDATSE